MSYHVFYELFSFAPRISGGMQPLLFCDDNQSHSWYVSRDFCALTMQPSVLFDSIVDFNLFEGIFDSADTVLAFYLQIFNSKTNHLLLLPVCRWSEGVGVNTWQMELGLRRFYFYLICFKAFSPDAYECASFWDFDAWVWHDANLWDRRRRLIPGSTKNTSSELFPINVRQQPLVFPIMYVGTSHYLYTWMYTSLKGCYLLEKLLEVILDRNATAPD